MADPVLGTQDAGNTTPANTGTQPGSNALAANTGTTPPAATGNSTMPPNGSDPATPPSSATPASTPTGEKPKVDPTPEGAPAEYKFVVPEGVSLDDEVTKEFSAYAKELNLPQEKAQKAIDMATKLVTKVNENYAKQVAETHEKWIADIKADKEFGGIKFDETVERANRVIRQFVDPKLKAELFGTGAMDHPEIVRMFAKIDKALGEDRIVDGQAPAAAGERPAKKMFPNQN